MAEPLGQPLQACQADAFRVRAADPGPGACPARACSSSASLALLFHSETKAHTLSAFPCTYFLSSLGTWPQDALVGELSWVGGCEAWHS